MIYANLPVTCRLIPIDTNDEVFQIVFMCNFLGYINRASLVYMNHVDNPETTSNEGWILYAAEWAKNLYNIKEAVEEDITEYIVQCLDNKHTKYILTNVCFYHTGFDMGDVTADNINYGIDLYNEILHKL